MPTQAEVQNIILSAQARKATLLQQNLTALSGGFNLVTAWCDIKVLNLYTKAVIRQYNIQDYVSANFIVVYDCLCKMLGININGATVDPSFQASNTIIDLTVNGVVPIIIDKNQNDLIEDGMGSGNWYLPFLNQDDQPFAANIKPLELTVDGVGIELAPNYNFVPMRLYGFANNKTQTIILTVI